MSGAGSHIDTQTPGGRYDGALGVIGGLIAVKVLRERFGTPRLPLECVALCEEESNRFPSANFWGSRAITGRVGPTDPDTVIGYDGKSIAEAMRDVGLDPARIPEAVREDIDTFVELHIEQGPTLEHAGLPVGLVTGITGIRHYGVELTGIANHAGAFPMDLRKDAMAGFAEIATSVVDTAHRWGRPAVTTIGRVNVKPNAPAIIAESVSFTLDARHPDPEASASACVPRKPDGGGCERRGLGLKWSILMDHPARPSDPDTVAALKAAADARGRRCFRRLGASA